MSDSYEPLIPAEAEIDEQGRLYCPAYGDVYHSSAGALGQARHVFLNGNGLPARWRGRDVFTVCETGFGLGLNFLALWQAWREDPARPARLHVLSIEGHPFRRDALAALLARYAHGSQADLAAQLAAQWPLPLPGLHRLEFEGGAVTLTLAFGRAEAVAPWLDARVDAYFLDGFAPDRNPGMWSPALMQALARLAAPQATVATWSSSGALRRALDEAGFEVRRAPGFGPKWHMTQGVIRAARPRPAPWPGGERHALVVGAGLAGAGVSRALARRGWRVIVVDAGRAGGAPVHAGHAAAALTPVIARDDNARARLSRAGSLCAQARWSGLPPSAAPRVCGTIQLERDAGRASAMADTLAALRFPEQWVRQVDREEASALAGLPVARGGVFFPHGMLIRPGALIDALLAADGIGVLGGEVARIAREGGGWRALDGAGRELARAPAVVLANAAGSRAVLQASGLLDPLPRMAQMHALAGEVTLVPPGALDGGPRCIIGGEGYLLPDSGDGCVAGSTYVHGARAAAVSAEGQRVTLGKAAGLLGRRFPGLEALKPGALPGWAGWRAVLPGRLPAVGELPHAPGVWLAAGYASRGLSWSALMGEVIGAALAGEPMPLESDLLRLIGPR